VDPAVGNRGAFLRVLIASIFLVMVVIFIPLEGRGFSTPVLPGKVGELRLDGGPYILERGSFYLHIDGEEELFEKFGAEKLRYAYYTGAGGSLTIELFTFREEEGASCMFRKISGREKENGKKVSGGTAAFFPGVIYGVKGKFFVRLFPSGKAGERAARLLLEELFSRISE